MNLAIAYDDHATYLEARALELRPTQMHDMGGWVGHTEPEEDRREAIRFRADAALIRFWHAT